MNQQHRRNQIGVKSVFERGSVLCFEHTERGLCMRDQQKRSVLRTRRSRNCCTAFGGGDIGGHRDDRIARMRSDEALQARVVTTDRDHARTRRDEFGGERRTDAAGCTCQYDRAIAQIERAHAASAISALRASDSDMMSGDMTSGDMTAGDATAGAVVASRKLRKTSPYKR